MSDRPEETEMESGSQRPNFRFTIWDILFLTSFVALLFAIPTNVVSVVVTIALLIVMLLGFFFLDVTLFGARRHWQMGSMKLFRKLIVRAVIYSAITVVVGSVSLLARHLVG